MVIIIQWIGRGKMDNWTSVMCNHNGIIGIVLEIMDDHNTDMLDHHHTMLDHYHIQHIIMNYLP